MKTNLKNIIGTLAVMLFMTTATICFAQTPPDGGFDDVDNPSVPIDGGVGFLAAGGIAYGIKKMRDYNKRK